MLQEKWHLNRMKKLCYDIVSQSGLDLKGIKVITEAGSGVFALTPFIAIIAGAKEVICLTKTTKYGSVFEIEQLIKKIAVEWELAEPIVTENRFDESLKGADVITNLGMVRPINRSLLEWVGKDVVIPYMCEAWEVRVDDVDFKTCLELGIPVMGTDESTPLLDIFSQCGMLAVKMILDSGLEVSRNRIAILSQDRFGTVIYEALNKSGATVTLYSDENYCGVENVEWDAIIVAEYNSMQTILGPMGSLDNYRLRKLLSTHPAIIQFAGHNDVSFLKQNGCLVYPDIKLESCRMSKTLADLGPKPMIMLHTAGLLVGKAMVEAKRLKLTGNSFEQYILTNSPAQIIN
ncbi:hypothetical protein DVH26_36600 [Paenibacillus sp. H1-7]|uniref:hypothetical protein n=1 Tax=Paenibacillus sp. H1-7 TaxID=2282849 RepID=UPI001EF82276|nr:hypothetical protein [Paenibacillus sp. H1-7]ULL19447.1 hypothetical protein DVH26_36600 [Paenibacillus sp. H1-7]